MDSDPLAEATNERAISPVIGVVVLIAITVLLVAIGGMFVFGLTDDPEPAPEMSFRFEYVGETNAITITVKAGRTITAANTDRLVVIVDGTNGDTRTVWAQDGGAVVDLNDGDLRSGMSITIDDATGTDTGDETLPFDLESGDELRIVWQAPDDDRTFTLARDTVPSLEADTVFGPLDVDGAVVSGSNGVTGDGGTAIQATPTGAQALGSTADLDDDDRTELPYVDASGNLVVNDSSGEIQVLVDSNSVASDRKPDTDKTLMATGTWNKSESAVFYAQAASAGGDKLYRVTPGSSPTEVADMSSESGIDSVHGVGDIDGDDEDELVYADNSQALRYLETNGTKQTAFTSLGSSEGIGSGTLQDVDGDSTDEAIVVDGSNDIRVIAATGPEATPAQSSVDAAKSPVTAADVDDDGNSEIVYIDDTSSELRYIDDVTGSETVVTLTDGNNDAIPGEKELGIVS